MWFALASAAHDYTLTRTTQAYDRSGGVPDLICSLYDLLHYTHEDGTPFELSLRSRLHMIMDIACALQHLSSKAFLHLDLASFNVLVWREEEGGVVRCKLADFSFAINQHSVSSRKKTMGGAPEMRSSLRLPDSRVVWKAPELVSDDPSKPCELSEVYAFGMVVYEILKRRVPYQGIADLAVSKLVQNDSTREKQLQLPEEGDVLPAGATDAARQQFQDVVDLMRRCLQTQPAQRPTFNDIVQRLHVIQGAQPVRSPAAAARTSAPPHAFLMRRRRCRNQMISLQHLQRYLSHQHLHPVGCLFLSSRQQLVRNRRRGTRTSTHCRQRRPSAR